MSTLLLIGAGLAGAGIGSFFDGIRKSWKEEKQKKRIPDPLTTLYTLTDKTEPTLREAIADWMDLYQPMFQEQGFQWEDRRAYTGNARLLHVATRRYVDINMDDKAYVALHPYRDGLSAKSCKLLYRTGALASDRVVGLKGLTTEQQAQVVINEALLLIKSL